MRIVQIQPWIDSNFRRLGAMTSAPLEQYSNHDDDDSEHQDRGKDYVGENAEIRIFSRRRDLDQKQQDNADEARDDDRRSDQTDVIAKDARRLGSKLFDSDWSVRGPARVQRMSVHSTWGEPLRIVSEARA